MEQAVGEEGVGGLELGVEGEKVDFWSEWVEGWRIGREQQFGEE